MNVKRLEKLAEFLETKVPEDRFDMSVWAEGETKPTLEPACGTSACALGWATVAFPTHLRLKKTVYRYAGVTRMVDWDVVGLKEFVGQDGVFLAKSFFDLSAWQAEAIFLSGKMTTKQKAQQIRYLIKEGK